MSQQTAQSAQQTSSPEGVIGTTERGGPARVLLQDIADQLIVDESSPQLALPMRVARDGSCWIRYHARWQSFDSSVSVDGNTTRAQHTRRMNSSNSMSLLQSRADNHRLRRKPQVSRLLSRHQQLRHR